MNREQRERLVDGALARALAPKQIEPRDGLEERLLANLAAQPDRRPWWRWVGVPVIAGAVVMLFVAIALQVAHRPAPVVVVETNHKPAQPADKVPAIAEIPAHPTQRAIAVAKRTVPRARRPVQVAHGDLPKQDVFPSPVPMTEQERLLLALVRHRPQQAKLIAAEQQAERERIQKFLETGEAPAEPSAQQ